MDPRSDRGPSAFNRTHRAVISYNYEVPFKNNGALKYLVDGWFTAGVISFQSGVPETIYVGGFDKNGNGEAYNDRPNWAIAAHRSTTARPAWRTLPALPA